MSSTAGSEQELWSAQFRRDREASWRELDKLATTIEQRGLGALGADALSRLPTLYRAALSSLSVARAVCLDRNLLDHLESLTARAHLCVYGPREGVAAAIGRFLRVTFPASVRAAAPQLLTALSTLLLGFWIAFTLCSERLDDTYFYFIDSHRAQGRDPAASVEQLRATLFDDGSNDSGALSAFAAFLWSHNSRVTLLAFGLAILGGVPGLLIVLITGFELGAMSALFHARGLAVEWWSWILPHGITELFAILLGTAAGLRLAQGLVFSGPHGRLGTMSQRGREAGPLVFGAILLLFLAGQIEGIFRQAVQDVPVRYLLAAATAALWTVYFLFAGRRAR
jgi:uncharacterized membrane protein SpoIIM required for sporulation